MSQCSPNQAAEATSPSTLGCSTGSPPLQSSRASQHSCAKAHHKLSTLTRYAHSTYIVCGYRKYGQLQGGLYGVCIPGLCTAVHCARHLWSRWRLIQHVSPAGIHDGAGACNKPERKLTTVLIPGVASVDVLGFTSTLASCTSTHGPLSHATSLHSTVMDNRPAPEYDYLFKVRLASAPTNVTTTPVRHRRLTRTFLCSFC